MGKFDFMARKKEMDDIEAMNFDVPEALQNSYSEVWGKNKENVVKIELNRIVVYTDNKGRTQPFSISEERVNQIKKSAEDVGIITPLIVRKIGDQYQIISGHHRYMAAKELNFLAVPCVIREISDEEAVQLVAESNIQRVKLTPIEYAEIYSRYMERKSDIDMTVQEIAEKFNTSKKSLYRYIKVLDLTEEMRDLVNKEMISVDTAEIFCNFSEENQAAVCEFVNQNNKKINRNLAKEMEQIVADQGENVSPELFLPVLDKKKKCKNKLYIKLSEKYEVEYSDKEWDQLVSELVDKYFSEL